MKQYTTETPLNSACIAPLRPYIILGGGQDAMNVTTTGQRAGKFESRFWHKLFEEEVGRVRGHLYVSTSASSVYRALLGHQGDRFGLDCCQLYQCWASLGWTSRRRRSISAVLMCRRRWLRGKLTIAAVPSTLSLSTPKARHTLPAPKTALSVSTGYVLSIPVPVPQLYYRLGNGSWPRTSS